MTAVSVLPVVGEVLFDARDDGRALRVSWHPVDDLCVLSIWRDGRCVATFQLARLETPNLINELVRGLVHTPPTPWTATQLTTIRSRRTRIAHRLRAARSRMSQARRRSSDAD